MTIFLLILVCMFLFLILAVLGALYQQDKELHAALVKCLEALAASNMATAESNQALAILNKSVLGWVSAVQGRGGETRMH